MDKWALNEEEEWDDLEDGRDAEANTSPGPDAPSGQDQAGAVQVVVTPMAEVVAVELGTGWKKSVDPRVLGEHVVTAANTATAQAWRNKLKLLRSNRPRAP